jgi:hypothetical protein
MPSFVRLNPAACAVAASLCFAASALAQAAKATVTPDAHHDLSAPLSTLKLPPPAPPPARPATNPNNPPARTSPDAPPPPATHSPLTAAVEQTHPGTRPAATLVTSFEGLGASFTGPQTAAGRNPSDNSLAVGPGHVVQIVNSRMAIFSKKGDVLFGSVVTNTLFAGFGGPCEERISGDAVVRYDQLAQRWLFVLPVFRRPVDQPDGPYSMCYAISQTSDPLGAYYRYEFKRPLFPDYPRPAIWPDGYYVPSSVGDTVIQKQACVADRNKMLKGEPATEQCVLLDGAGFLNNADIDGQALPAPGTPNIVIALGGAQLHNQFEDDGLYIYEFHVDWADPAKTAITGPAKITVAPYHYLCNGQLTKCVPQPGTETRLDAQGDKIMQRLVYRRIGSRESIVASHSVNTEAGFGGVRWYELRLDRHHDPHLFQQGTYTPDSHYRWMPSIDMDRNGNIGVGYSWGGAADFAGQRFAARLAKDPKGTLGLHETILAEGKAAQTNTLRWEDYTTTALDPSDDCTFWYVGDYIRAAGENYSTTIGAFRLPTCTSPSR